MLTVNDRKVEVGARPDMRLSRLLREELGLTGTKVGCDAGDCGACTVLIDEEQACACLVPAAQLEGRRVQTVEGLAGDPIGRALQRSFHHHGAAQCGICTPGMLMASLDLLRRVERADLAMVEAALGGVLCRCTGYLKICEAVLDAANFLEGDDEPAAEEGAFSSEDVEATRARAEPRSQATSARNGAAVGARLARLDGIPKLDGSEVYGADKAPQDALWLRAIRSPHARARFTIGDLGAFVSNEPGIFRVLTAADVPGENSFGIFPEMKDQPVFAEVETRYRGEAVAAIVGERASIDGFDVGRFPIRWELLEPLAGLDAALSANAHASHASHPDNVLVRGWVEKGNAAGALRQSTHRADGRFSTAFVEHAYIEPEAGFGRRIGDRVEVFASTQAPYMSRDEVARVLGLAPGDVRIIPSACGGGFGGKLDVSLQPHARHRGLADGRAGALRLHTTRIHGRDDQAPSGVHHQAHAACDAEGRITAYAMEADFDTGAYSSWGPTVAGRVPVHGAGPYRVPNVLNRARAIYTNGPIAGAFRGFGVPQAAIAHEALYDEFAEECGLDRLEFRLLNALRVGRRDGDRPGSCRRASGSTAASRRCVRSGRECLPRRSAQRRGRASRAAASASPACGTVSATRRSPTLPACALRSRGKESSCSSMARSISARARPRC